MPHAIDVRLKRPGLYEVAVTDRTATRHEVTVDAAYAESLAPGSPADELVRQSFEFLLDREPNTSILSRFDLPVIQRYFPDYERTMKRVFSA